MAGAPLPRTVEPVRAVFPELFEAGGGRRQVAFLDAEGTVLARWPVEPRQVDVDGLPVRRIVADALVRRSAGVLIAHTHGERDPVPSGNDVAETRRLAHTARRFDIRVLDHFVIGRGEWRSFRGLELI